MRKKLAMVMIALGVVALLFTMGYGALTVIGPGAQATSVRVTRTAGTAGGVVLAAGILLIASARKPSAPS